MQKKGPVLLVALAVTNWLPHRQTHQPNHAHFDLPVTNKVELKAIQAMPRQNQSDETKGLPFGNLRKLNLTGIGGRLILNGIELETITSDSIDLESANQEFRVRATFLKTIMVKMVKQWTAVTRKHLTLGAGASLRLQECLGIRTRSALLSRSSTN